MTTLKQKLEDVRENVAGVSGVQEVENRERLRKAIDTLSELIAEQEAQEIRCKNLPVNFSGRRGKR